MLILSESNVKQLLSDLTPERIQKYQKAVSTGLSDFHKDASIQPSRMVITTPFATHLYMGCAGTTVGMKALTGSKEGFKGLVTVLDPHTGIPEGLVNAFTLTAFRTAISTSLALIKAFPLDRSDIGDTLICHGSGPQAYWHIKIALILYKELSNIYIVDRTLENANKLVNRFKADGFKQTFQTIKDTDADSIKKAYENASIVFSCVPSTSPTVLESNVSFNKQPRLFIGTIGSYKPNMIEIEGSVLKDECISKGGLIMVDSTQDCLGEAGEFIQNSIGEDSLIDIAEVSENTVKSAKQLKYLKSGKVIISKLVGLCVMDVAAGFQLLKEGAEMHLGVNIDDF